MDNNNGRKRKKRKSRVKNSVKIVFLLLFLVISGTAGFFVAKARVTFNQTLNHVKRDYNSKLSSVDLSGIKVKSDNDIVNILLIGNDRRDEKYYSNKRGLTDVIIIATMDRKHGVLKLSSVMRDLRVYVPASGSYEKINAATNHEGEVKSLYKTLAQNFNIKLDGYVQVDFEAFKEVVNALGGVEVELTDTEARYLSITNYIQKKKNRKGLKTGKQVLNGDQALGYCRIRKGIDMIGEPVVTASGLIDDYGRTWRQRAVLSSAFEKLKTMPLTKWYDIANKVLGHVVTDLDNDQILQYMKDVATMGTTDIYQLQIPQNPYFRIAPKGEFDSSEYIVPTDGVSSEQDIGKNKEILSQFIFKYNGKGEFEFKDSSHEG
ncbi:MAG: LCP family protein [Lachnospiraceae bacterium]|nr:LCP family protein [Lachnospiraceae bacterium]